MKIRIFTLLFISTLLSTSCSSDDLIIEEMSLSKSEQKAIQEIVTTNLSITEQKQIVITSVKLKKIDDTYYLSMYHGDEVSTTLLKVVNGATLKYAGITCTSKTCSTNDGCIPHSDGKKCTKCPLSSDCSKTVTSDELVQ